MFQHFCCLADLQKLDIGVTLMAVQCMFMHPLGLVCPVLNTFVNIHNSNRLAQMTNMT